MLKITFRYNSLNKHNMKEVRISTKAWLFWRPRFIIAFRYSVGEYRLISLYKSIKICVTEEQEFSVWYLMKMTQLVLRIIIHSVYLPQILLTFMEIFYLALKYVKFFLWNVCPIPKKSLQLIFGELYMSYVRDAHISSYKTSVIFFFDFNWNWNVLININKSTRISNFMKIRFVFSRVVKHKRMDKLTNWYIFADILVNFRNRPVVVAVSSGLSLIPLTIIKKTSEKCLIQNI
jgi:hypothetical protein